MSHAPDAHADAFQGLQCSMALPVQQYHKLRLRGSKHAHLILRAKSSSAPFDIVQLLYCKLHAEQSMQDGPHKCPPITE